MTTLKGIQRNAAPWFDGRPVPEATVRELLDLARFTLEEILV